MHATITALLILALTTSGCVSRQRQQRATAKADLGAAYLREGNSESALGVLQEATRLDPHNWDAWNKLGLAYMAKGVDEPAEQAFKRALGIAPEQAEVNNNYGLLLLQTGRTDDAITRFEVATGDLTYRNPSMVLNNLGHALYLTGRYDEAKKRLDEAIKRAPNLCQARFNRGLVSKAQGLHRDAVDDFDAVIHLCGSAAAGAWYHAAQSLLALDDRPTACRYLDEVTATAPRTEMGDAATDLKARECR